MVGILKVALLILFSGGKWLEIVVIILIYERRYQTHLVLPVNVPRGIEKNICLTLFHYLCQPIVTDFTDRATPIVVFIE